jgi:hypothetical protein
MSDELGVSLKTKAILFEISEALQRFINTGAPWSIFIDKVSLTDEERQIIRDFLGRGSITINLSDSAEPAEWMESGISGIWYGVFYDQTKKPILETIEIGKFPQVPSAQMEDINSDFAIFKQRLRQKTE